MMRLLCTLFFLSLHLVQVMGQVTSIQNKIGANDNFGVSQKSLLKAAEKASEGKDYFSAFKYYEMALGYDTSAEILRRYADAALAFHAYESSISALQLLTVKFPTSDTDDVLRLADAYFAYGDYEKALDTYNTYLKNSQNRNIDLLKRAQQGIEKTEWAMETLSESDRDIIVERLGDDVNTDYSEFSPLKVGDKFYFSSYQFPYENDKKYPKRKLTKVLLQTSNEGNNRVDLADFNASSVVHTAHVSFTQDRKRMYFTNCDFSDGFDIQCKIYVRSQNASGIWSDATVLPEHINLPGYTTTEPNVGKNPETGKEVLYFASNRPGSKGKRDLWFAEILADNQWSAPINLSALNTTEDDITPYFDDITGTLFFSSDGRKTFGGYDIFGAKMSGGIWSQVDHLPIPINSSDNDIYYTLADNGMEAFLASNRSGSRSLDSIACCYDIYRVDLFKPVMKAIAFHGITKDSLSGVTMQLIELSGSNEEVKIDVAGVQTDFPIRTSKSYMLIGTKSGFSSDTVYFQTPDKPWKGYWIEKLNLQPKQVNLIVYAFDARTNEPLIGTTCEFQDLGLVLKSGEIASSKSIEGLRSSADTNQKSHRFDYGLEFERRYKVLIRKNGYTIDSAFVTTEGLVKSQTIEKKLYLFKGGVKLEALAFNGYTKEPLMGTNLRFYEVSSTRNEVKSNVDGNDYYFGLDFERSYWVIVNKSGYSSDSVLVTTRDINKFDFHTLTRSLYLYPELPPLTMPIVLYFDNDEPDQRVLRTTTIKSYGDTYTKYYARKQEFVRIHDIEGGFSAGSAEEGLMVHFFEADVKGGWGKLQLFTDAVLKDLQSGKSVEIEITGFASPRAKSDYNEKLTGRRISSIKNHFRMFGDGVFVPFIESRQLLFSDNPKGEATAPLGISDVLEDQKNSVFSVKASRERRVELKSRILLKN